MIRVDNVSVTAGTFVLPPVSFEIPTGSYGILMGPSGVGKTTLLEAICGLRPVQSGRIQLHGQDMTRVPPAQRRIGYVPQDGVLFPTMTVRENLALPLRVRKYPATHIRRHTEELAHQLGITHLLPRSPLGLSGGERQRVALGRALIFTPAILCLDEPLSALDPAAREQFCLLLQTMHRAMGTTVLHVTHNAQETATLATCIVSLDADKRLHHAHIDITSKENVSLTQRRQVAKR